MARFLSRAFLESDRFSFSPTSFAFQHDRNRDSLIQLRISISSVIYVDLSRGLVDRDVLIEIRNILKSMKKILHPLPFGSFLCRFGCLASNRFLATLAITMLGFDEAKY